MCPIHSSVPIHTYDQPSTIVRSFFSHSSNILLSFFGYPSPILRLFSTILRDMESLSWTLTCQHSRQFDKITSSSRSEIKRPTTSSNTCMRMHLPTILSTILSTSLSTILPTIIRLSFRPLFDYSLTFLSSLHPVLLVRRSRLHSQEEFLKYVCPIPQEGTLH
jgi:hypothetical protein